MTKCYILPSRLYVRRKRQLESQEETTQGDAIAICMYALGITALMTVVTSPSESMRHSHSNMFYNVAFAEDFTGGENRILKF